MLVLFLSMYLKPSEIRFTQDSIAWRFQDGGYLDDAIDDIKNGSLYPENFPNIHVVDLHKGLYSFDNRRLYVFRVSEYNGWISKIPVNRVSAWNLIPDRFTTKNEGVELYVRQGRTRPHYLDSWLLKQDYMGNRNIPAYQSTSYTDIQSTPTSQTLNLPHQTTSLPGIQDTMANLSIGPATVYENLNVVESAVVRRKSIVSENTSSDSVRTISVSTVTREYSPVCMSSKAPGTTKFSSRTIFVDTISRRSSNVSNTIPSTTASSVRMDFSNTISRQNSAVSGSSRANFSMRKISMNTILQQRSDVPDSALSLTNIADKKTHYAVSRQNSNASNNIPDSASARNSTVDTISQYSDTSGNLLVSNNSPSTFYLGTRTTNTVSRKNSDSSIYTFAAKTSTLQTRSGDIIPLQKNVLINNIQTQATLSSKMSSVGSLSQQGGNVSDHIPVLDIDYTSPENITTKSSQQSKLPDYILAPFNPSMRTGTLSVTSSTNNISRQQSDVSDNLPAELLTTPVRTESEHMVTRQTSEASNRIRTPVLDAPSENPAIDPPVCYRSNSEQRQKIALFQRFLNCCCFCCNKS